MDKVEDRGTILQAGRESPESEHLSIAANSSRPGQPDDDQRLIGLGIALARALQQLGAKSDNSQP